MFSFTKKKKKEKANDLPDPAAWKYVEEAVKICDQLEALSDISGYKRVNTSQKDQSY